MALASLIQLVLAILLTAAISEATDDIYSIQIQDIKGKSVSLEEYRGKVLLMVNVASECGYTDSNYKELVLLQEDHESNNFAVLGFPCNQFEGQEPGSDSDIERFTKEKYNVNFPVFSKVSVYGENATRLYRYLYENTGSKPSWNFFKYLVDQDGEVVQIFTEKDSFSFIRHSVEYLVRKRTDL